MSAGVAPPGAVLDAATVRRVLLLATTTWAAFHIAMALAFQQDHQPVVLQAALIVLTGVLVAVGLRPLYRPVPRRIPPAVGYPVAMCCVAVTAATEPFLTAAGMLGWGNWPLRSLPLVVAALAFRRCVGGAVLAAVGMAAVNAVVVWRLHERDPDVPLTAAILMAVPVVTWLLLALALRFLVDPSLTTTESYRRRRLEAEAEAAVSRAIRDADDARRADLHDRVLPVLTRLADEEHILTDADREDASVMAASLRDDLKARWLLTAAVREDILAARRRGLQVMVSCDPPSPPPGDERLVATTRLLLGRLLTDLPTDARLSCRVTFAQRSSVFAVHCDSHDDLRRAAETVRDLCARQTGVRAVVQDPEGELLVEVTVAPVAD